MRKKGYELIASALAEAHAGEVSRLYAAKRPISAVVVNWYHKRLVAEVADRLASMDPKFDRQQFITSAEMAAREAPLSTGDGGGERSLNEVSGNSGKD